ncbi:TetR/AcrR family transcriptional regulator [Streptomyces sp. NPDC060223]|uniref:TetR/AcrR family transcriptional regulator n=1 Tax=unclassified Streptomyces TaxID=2593676 RepID=UPI00362A67ED
MTVSAIAQHAGVAKQTIYRWWRSKVSILIDVLEEDLPDEAPWPARPKPPEAALEHHVLHLSAVFTRSSTGHVLFVLIGHALQDPATAVVLRDQVLSHRRRYDLDRLHAALADGPPRALNGHKAGQLLDLTVGPAFYRAFMTGQPMDPGFVKRLTAAAVGACHGSTPPRPSPSD